MLAALMFATLSAGAAPVSLEPARELAADGRAAAAGNQPVIVLVSLAGCPHCEVVRRSHLLPLLAEDAGPNIPPIRQIELNGSQRVVDFAGTAMSHAEFSRRLGARLAPVVFFFGPQGEMLTDPLVGAMIPDFYGAYFDAALERARTKLKVVIRP